MLVKFEWVIFHFCMLTSNWICKFLIGELKEYVIWVILRNGMSDETGWWIYWRRKRLQQFERGYRTVGLPCRLSLYILRHTICYRRRSLPRTGEFLLAFGTKVNRLQWAFCMVILYGNLDHYMEAWSCEVVNRFWLPFHSNSCNSIDDYIDFKWGLLYCLKCY